MAQTKEGARKAQKTIMERYSREQRAEWGRRGGKAKVKKGFARMDKQKLSEVGSMGGTNRWKKQ